MICTIYTPEMLKEAKEAYFAYRNGAKRVRTHRPKRRTG